MMKNNFTLDDYSLLLQYFGKEREYVTFSEYQNKSDNDPIVLLRHDIDFSLKHALEMAKLEAGLGIKSTVFLLFSSPFYNILDVDNIQIVRQIHELGHEIGLHYDLAVLEKGNGKDPFALLNAEAEILKQLTGSEVLSIAMHNPSMSGADIFRETKYINTYDERFTKQMAYFSDSCMAWRNNFIEHTEKNSFPPRLQLLIHPILWSEEELTRWDKLDKFVSMKVGEIENEGKIVFDMWKQHSGVNEHDLRIANQKVN